MPNLPIRCSCPHCGHRLGIKDGRLAGKKIKCPKCQEPFVVKASAEEQVRPKASVKQASPPGDVDDDTEQEEDDRPRAKKKRSADDDEDAADEDRPRVKKSRRRDEEDSEEEDRPRKKKKRKQSGALVWVVAGGGVAVAAALAVVLILVLQKSGDGSKGPDRAADLHVNIGGPWPEPKFGGFAAGPESLTFRVVIPGMSYQKSGREMVQDMEEAIADKLAALVGVGGAGAGASDDEPGGSGRRITSRFGNVKEDANDIAKKIDFGTVRSVNGRVITLVVSKIEGLPPPGADAVTRALYHLKSPNERRRERAAEVFKKQQPDERRAEVVKALEALLTEKNKFTRAYAIEGLGVWGSKEHGPLLLKILREEKGFAAEARKAAIMALGRLKDERAIQPIAERLEDFFDRRDAGEALKMMGPAAEKEVLLRLTHKDGQIRTLACQILEVIGTNESIPALERLAAEDRFLAGTAQNAIKAIQARK